MDNTNTGGFTDQTLTCRDCGNTFTWTASEQEFYAKKGFSQPLCCPACRAARKTRFNDRGGRGGGGGGGGFSDGPRKMYDAVCSNCGKPCQVPFQPTLDENGKPVKPVYCRDCFQKMKGN